MAPDENHLFLRMNEEVVEEKRHKQPIVALETNVVINGLPYAQNIETVDKIEAENSFDILSDFIQLTKLPLIAVTA